MIPRARSRIWSSMVINSPVKGDAIPPPGRPHHKLPIDIAGVCIAHLKIPNQKYGAIYVVWPHRAGWSWDDDVSYDVEGEQ